MCKLPKKFSFIFFFYFMLFLSNDCKILRGCLISLKKVASRIIYSILHLLVSPPSFYKYTFIYILLHSSLVSGLWIRLLSYDTIYRKILFLSYCSSFFYIFSVCIMDRFLNVKCVRFLFALFRLKATVIFVALNIFKMSLMFKLIYLLFSIFFFISWGNTMI